MALLDALPGPTKTLLSSVKKAGVPKVTNGKKIAQAYVTALQAIEKALPGIEKQAAALPQLRIVVTDARGFAEGDALGDFGE